MSTASETEQAIERALQQTERSGLRLVLAIRSVLAVTAAILILLTQGPQRGLMGAGVALAFLVAGLVYWAIVAAERDRIWTRYAFISGDIIMLGVVAAILPLAQQGEVPQIFVFRVYGIGIFLFVLATSALSLSPGLVLWSGGAIIATVWAAWGWIVWQMDRVVMWSDYAQDPTAENYIRIVLDPDMIQMANRVTDSIVVAATAIVTAAAVQRARTMLRKQIASERERAEINEVFGRFVPQEVAETLGRSGGTLPPAHRMASVMFVDIQGFTTLSEGMEPQEITAMLDSFFDAVGRIASEHRGVCISLIGDAALVSFNAPLDNPDHAGCAIKAAQSLRKHVASHRFEGHSLSIRIGIATGKVAAGTVGGRGRRSYTLYGDTVNLAQRLEALNKEMDTGLLIDQATAQAAGMPGGLVEAGQAAVRGRMTSTRLFTALPPE